MDRTHSAPEEGAYPNAKHPHVRNKLGEAIRSQYELAGPLPDRLYRLVKEFERRFDAARKPRGWAGHRPHGRPHASQDS
jgi:hypothetical protein